MTDRRITVQDRVRPLGRLDGLARELKAAAAWLRDSGLETEADMLEQSARSILAACWLIERPIRRIRTRSDGSRPLGTWPSTATNTGTDRRMCPQTVR
jgi:hypothetical protein